MKKIILLFFFLISLTVEANVYLPNIFQHNMVLQQQTEIAIWGTASPGEKVTISASWDTKTYTTVGSDNATFRVKLKTPQAGGPYNITVSGENKIVVENILIGEVWICAGQSNMEWSAAYGVKDAKAELATCYNPNLRLFKMPKTTATTPQNDCKGTWKVCDSTSMKQFSAVGYFFGKKLNQNLKVPIGLIDIAWGGSYMESWIAESLINLYPDTQSSAQKMIRSNGWPSQPALIYNGMVAPLTDFNIAGVIWYQGESNRHVPNTYYKLTHIMVESWRGIWQTEFPFYYVQIAPFNYRDSTNLKAALVREMQTKSMDLPKSGMIVTTDLVDDINNIHPAYKKEVGNRLANWALAETYSQNVGVYKSPQYKNMSILGNKATITFDHAEDGLTIKGTELTEFLVAGTDQIFYKAKAQIKNNGVEVWSDKVPNPVAVRFAFGDMPNPNLFGKSGLPAVPFRTDNWASNRVNTLAQIRNKKEGFIYEKAPFPSCHASTIVETSNKTMIAAWFGGTHERHKDVGIWTSRIENGQWTTPVEVANGVQNATLRYPTWNPVLFQMPKGDLLLFYKVGPSPSEWWGMLKRSTDGGITWSEAEKLPEGILGPIKNKPVLLADGTLLCPTSSEHDGWRVHFEMTKDAGKTWQKTAAINDGKQFSAIQPSVLFHADGRLQILCRSKNGAILEAYSKDNAKTWSELKATSLPNPNSGTDAVTLKDGRQLLVYNHVTKESQEWGGNRSPLNVAISKDGIHWEEILTLENEPKAEFSYPAVIQTADGKVHITYTWKRQRIKHVVMEL
jgi:sialate O-acetylesterase